MKQNFLCKSVVCTLLLLSNLLWAVPLSAQSRVSGTVLDESGSPVIGATIIIDGTTKGTTTNSDGVFTLDAERDAAVTISYIGYADVHTSLVDGMKIALESDSEQIDEVVVVGYGVQKKETLTGAISVVGSDMMESKGAIASPLQALQGQVPGVIITRSTSAPGEEGWDMSLRGSVSTNSTPPLVIVDGIALDSSSDLALINPSDIESMSFLKDASAAIYGSRAAGGVVLVTTKKGSSGKVKVEYNASYTSKFVGLTAELMNVDQWSTALIEACQNDGLATDSQWYSFALLAQQYNGSYINTIESGNPLAPYFSDVNEFVFLDGDWWGSLFDTGHSTQHDVSVSGGSDKSTYRLSLGYLYDGSVLQWGNNKNERYNIRLNNNFNITDRVSIASAIGYTRKMQVTPTNIASVLTEQIAQPGLPLTNQYGLPYAWGTGWFSPAWELELGGDNKLDVSTINISEQLNIDLGKGFSTSVSLAYTSSQAERNAAYNSVDYYAYDSTVSHVTSPTSDSSYYWQTSNRTDFYSATYLLNYSNTFNDDHNISASLGTQYEYTYKSYFGATITDVNSDLNALLGSGEISLIHTSSNTKIETALTSFFARANYNYKSTYLVELQGRYDGSSKFLPENRWDMFYGVSLGWRLSQEHFMKDATWLDELKIRASYGVVGNQSGIGNYDGVQLYNLSSDSGSLINGALLSELTTTGTLASTTRQWERIHNNNLGVDFAMLNNRLSGTLEYFNKKNNNMLVSETYSSVLGINAPSSNTGRFESYGGEAMIQWRDRIGDDMSYNIGGTVTYATNEVVYKGGAEVLSSGLVSSQQGYALNSIFGYQCVGKIQNEAQLEEYINKYYSSNEIGMPSNLRLGDNMYEDVNNDGKLTADDLVCLGSDDPELTFSFNAGFTWRELEVNVTFQGAALRTVYRSMGNWTMPMRAAYLNSTTTSIGNVWSVDNPDGYYTPYTLDTNITAYNYLPSSWTVENGAYLRLKDVTVAYSIPAKVLARQDAISACRIYVTGADVWELCSISDGFDPETSSNASKGTDRYPFTRNITFGVGLTF